MKNLLLWYIIIVGLTLSILYDHLYTALLLSFLLTINLWRYHE